MALPQQPYGTIDHNALAVPPFRPSVGSVLFASETHKTRRSVPRPQGADARPVCGLSLNHFVR
jgi:hypothetical protein